MSIDISAVNAAQSIFPHTTVKAKESSRVSTGQPRTDIIKTESPVAIDTVLAELTRVSAAFNRRLSFTLNEKLGEVVVKVIDTQTDKVIREIPPAEVQHAHERIREVIGILFDERA